MINLFEDDGDDQEDAEMHDDQIDSRGGFDNQDSNLIQIQMDSYLEPGSESGNGMAYERETFMPRTADDNKITLDFSQAVDQPMDLSNEHIN